MESLKRLLWWILAGSSGGPNRARIIHLLARRPFNANKIAHELGLDYKTVRHHLGVLEENNLIISRGQGYGKMYFVSPMLERDMASFREIWEEIGKTQINKAGDSKERKEAPEAESSGAEKDHAKEAGKGPVKDSMNDAGKGDGKALMKEADKDAGKGTDTSPGEKKSEPAHRAGEEE